MPQARRQSNDSLEARFDNIEAGKHVLSAYKNGAFSVAGSTNTTLSWDGYDADRSRGITVSGSQISFSKAGIYKITASARYTSDVWCKHWMKDAAGNIIGEAAWSGGSNGPGTFVFMANVSSPQACTILFYASIGGMSIQVPAPTGSPEGQVVRTMTLTIEEM